MNILHVTAYHLAVSRGGTEIYIDGLADALSRHNVENRFLVLSEQARIADMPDVCILVPHSGIPELKDRTRRYLVENRPDFIFFHTSDTWEYLVGELARELRIPFFYFFHAASWLCYQRNRKFLDQKPCSIMFDAWRCAVCRAGHGRRSRGIFAASLLELFRLLRLRKNSAYHAYREELAHKEHLVRSAERCIVFTEKDRMVFLANGFDTRKIYVCPQELKRTRLEACLRQAQRERTGIPKFGYVGRCCRIKGVDILVAAALQLPRDLEFELRIYGCDWSDLYCRDLRAAAGCAPRIRFYKMLPADEVPERLGSLDVLCIPSVVFETGPLTLREGVYSGCLVAGSDQVGQMDFLTRYGRKIAPNHANAWAEFMRDCILDIGNIRNSRKTEFPEAKSMDSVAENVLSEIRQINEPCRC